MIIVVALDDKNGMMFNNRRQSKDRFMLDNLLELTRECCLRVGSDSQGLFEDVSAENLYIGEDYLSGAQSGDYCFVENPDDLSDDIFIEGIVEYFWNRAYPADKVFNINPQECGLNLIEETEFEGYSHETITRKIFR